MTEEEKTERGLFYKAYVGCGDANTPEEVFPLIIRIAKYLDNMGYVLRVSGVSIPDEAFLSGAVREPEIYLPWKEFNNKTSKTYRYPEAAKSLTLRYHRNFANYKLPAQAMAIRNTCMVEGKYLTSRASLIICWTPDGCESSVTRSAKTGFTAPIITMATELNIPIFNLKNPDAPERLKEHLSYWDIPRRPKE